MLCLGAIAGHNALDGVEVTGAGSWLWTILHAPGALTPAPGYTIAVPYVLVPWVFVMALGYCCGPVFTVGDGEETARADLDRDARRDRLRRDPRD